MKNVCVCVCEHTQSPLAHTHTPLEQTSDLSCPLSSRLMVHGKGKASKSIPSSSSITKRECTRQHEELESFRATQILRHLTPEHDPQSLSFFPSYESMLPTSLPLCIQWTRCSEPWRLDEVMGARSCVCLFVRRRGAVWICYAHVLHLLS